MKKTRTKTPAPEGQQGPPTRVAASDQGRSLRDARGSLPLTSGTACAGARSTVDLSAADDWQENPRCWLEGYWTARRYESEASNPYRRGSKRSWSWLCGYIEGADRPHGLQTETKRLAAYVDEFGEY